MQYGRNYTDLRKKLHHTLCHPVKVYLVPGCTGVYVSWLSNVQHQPLTQLGLAWLGLTGSARLSSVQLGSARLGLSWFGWLG